MAQRYGTPPHLFLKQSLRDFNFNLFVATIGIEHDVKLKEKQARQQRHGKKRS